MISQLQIGAQLPEFRVEADPERMKTMAALMRDPNPIHWDIKAVRKSGMGDRLVNQGPIGIGYVVSMLTDWIGDTGRLRHIKLRCIGIVFEREKVCATGAITGVRNSGVETIVDCSVWLARADGSRALDGVATVALIAQGARGGRNSS